MKFHAHIFFKSNPIDQPLDISNIVKIMVDQKEVLPDKLKIDSSETIILIVLVTRLANLLPIPQWS